MDSVQDVLSNVFKDLSHVNVIESQAKALGDIFEYFQVVSLTL